MAARLSVWLKRGWGLLRQLSGDDAYERYLVHHAASHPERLPLSRRDWFRRHEQEKWGGIRRCC